MVITKELNLEQTEKIFRDYTIMIGSGDFMPKDVAEKLLGVDAVRFANKLGEDYNVYGLGELGMYKEITYLTKRGFFKAVTYKNIMLHTKLVET